VPDLWVPGAAEPSLDDFVERLHRQIERFTATHGADRSHVVVQLSDGLRLTLRGLSGEPGYGFVTLNVHPEEDDDPQELIVPVGAIRRIELGPAEAGRARFGFSLPDDVTRKGEGAEPAA
jgi:hypothetical protein